MTTMAEPALSQAPAPDARGVPGRGPRPEQPGGVALRLWDGSAVQLCGHQAGCTIAVQSPAALRRLLLRPNALTLGRLYVHGEVDLEGDLAALSGCTPPRGGILARLAWHAAGRGLQLGSGLEGEYRARGRTASRARARAAIAHHYDQPPSFWREWLDPALQYTCAYFREPAADLAQAQLDKMRYVCEKLALRPGAKLLDIGCGWGGLIRLAAKEYGVRAVGVTLSQSQFQFVRGAVAAEGLSERCEVRLADFRDMREDGGFDAVSGVGVIEHLGPGLAGAYFAAARRLLRPGGLMLNQGIVRDVRHGRSPGAEWVRRYVFPDAELMPISRTLVLAEEAGLVVRDVECLSEHYPPTLRAWRAGLEGRRAAIEAMVGPQVYRTFRLYLAGFEGLFAAGRFGLFQSVLERTGPATAPRTRESLYRRGAGADGAALTRAL